MGCTSSKHNGEEESDTLALPCPVCNKLALPVQHDRHGFKGQYKAIKTSIKAWQQAVERGHCSFCMAAWQAFESFPPAQGWPPKQKVATFHCYHSAAATFELGLVKEPGQLEPMGDHYVTSNVKLGDEEYTVDMYLYLPLSSADLNDDNDRVIWRKVAVEAGDPQSIKAASSWLRKCNEEHPGCAKHSTFLPSRLLFIKDDRIFLKDMDTASGLKYATLSYCWGKGDIGITTTIENRDKHGSKGLLIDELPPTIRDAVLVAVELGIFLIWIDRLCIIQDDNQDWVREAARMCDIYHNATLCISADRAKDVWAGFLKPQSYAEELTRGLKTISCNGLDWVIGPHRDHSSLASLIQNRVLPISHRAWTLQEQHMSQRVLHFLPTELVWECNTVTMCECQRDRVPSSKLLQESGITSNPGTAWSRIVLEYQHRSLTRAEDKLPAFSGLSTQFGRQYPGQYVAGLWKDDLPRQLCWLSPYKSAEKAWRQMLNDEHAVINRHDTYTAPTWSWASITGPVEYFRTYPEVPFQSMIDVISVNTELLNPDNPYGSISGGNLKLEGFVLDVELEVVLTQDADDNLDKLFMMTDQYDNICGVKLDDMNSSQLQAVQSVKCLLIGCVHFKSGDGSMVVGVDEIDGFSAVCAQAKPGSSAERRKRVLKEEDHPLTPWYNGYKATRPVPPVVSHPQGMEQKTFDDLYDTVDVDDGFFAPFTFYLVLKGAGDNPGVYERLACLHAGLNPDKKLVLKDMFRHCRRETLTIV